MNWKSIGLHIGFWVVIVLSFAISEWKYDNTFLDALIIEILFLPSRVIAVYINWFVLVPLYLYKGNAIRYALWLILIIAVLAVLQRMFLLYWGYPVFFPESVVGQNLRLFKPSRLMQYALIIVTAVAYTTGWKLFMDWKDKQAKTKELEKEKTETELKYLKSQINPHFLFNTLNNIYGLALDNDKRTPELILKLSEFLSFSLYESTQKFIPLDKEIGLMNDFISLEKSRFTDRVEVEAFIADYPGDILIPPLILTPFVENAFKHSLKDETGVASIVINLVAAKDRLHFSIKNSKPAEHSESPTRGIGLKNIKKRLDIIYENNYQLNIQEEESSYSVDLKITLS